MLTAMASSKIKAAILGTGNIGTDLMCKLLRDPGNIELALFAGIDPREILLELGRRKAMAGQEDWILDVAQDLVFRQKRNP